MMGIISIHCRPGFTCDKDQCAPNDEEAIAPGIVQAGKVSEGITSTANENDASSQKAVSASYEAGADG